MTLQECIEKAKAASACIEELAAIAQYATLEEAAEDEDAPYWCYWYAIRVLHRRWVEMEPVILQDVLAAIDYASFVLRQRWPELEVKIAGSPTGLLLYTIKVIGKRWPEAEPVVQQDTAEWAEYRKVFGF